MLLSSRVKEAPHARAAETAFSLNLPFRNLIERPGHAESQLATAACHRHHSSPSLMKQASRVREQDEQDVSCSKRACQRQTMAELRKISALRFGLPLTKRASGEAFLRKAPTPNSQAKVVSTGQDLHTRSLMKTSLVTRVHLGWNPCTFASFSANDGTRSCKCCGM